MSDFDISSQTWRKFVTMLTLFFKMMMRWWNCVKPKLTGERFNHLTFYWLSAQQPSKCWLFVWKVGELSTYLTPCLSCLAQWLWQENIFPLIGHNLNSQSYFFLTFLHYNLQLSSEFRLCNIIIVSECQTGNLKTVMMRLTAFQACRVDEVHIRAQSFISSCQERTTLTNGPGSNTVPRLLQENWPLQTQLFTWMFLSVVRISWDSIKWM